MTIQEVIARVDSLKPNTYTEEQKIKWLNNIEMTIKAEILDTHEGSEAYADFTGYNADTPLDTELIVDEPYCVLYERWIEAQIDYANGELDRYQNSFTMFNAAYSDFARYYNRTYTPHGVNFRYI